MANKKVAIMPRGNMKIGYIMKPKSRSLEVSLQIA